jgi:hypothetical protein
MRKKRTWTCPWRRKVASEEAAETARMLLEWLSDKPHALADPAAREKAVRDLIEVIEEGPPVELLEHSPRSKCLNSFRHSNRRFRFRLQAANYGHTHGRNACPKGSVHPAHKNCGC